MTYTRERASFAGCVRRRRIACSHDRKFLRGGSSSDSSYLVERNAYDKHLRPNGTVETSVVPQRVFASLAFLRLSRISVGRRRADGHLQWRSQRKHRDTPLLYSARNITLDKFISLFIV